MPTSNAELTRLNHLAELANVATARRDAVIEYAHRDGISAREIAAAVGLSVSQVNRIVARSRER